jgi:myo-inositol 2-dehydrogenase/D-chiro-inositol 1-dehydrogenase
MGSRATVRIEQAPRRNVSWRTPGVAAVPLVADFTERFAAAYRAEVEDFGACVHAGRAPRAGAAEALAAFDLAVAADRAWRTGGTVACGPGEPVGAPLPGGA